MKKKLLSLKQKRELLQRMAAAVREGVALDAFCAGENIEREMLFEHLAEMRALGTQGINPFLPDVGKRRLTKTEKLQALEAMEAYRMKTDADTTVLCLLAGKTDGFLFGLRNAKRIFEGEAEGMYPPLVDLKKLSPRQKLRLVAAIYKKVKKDERVAHAARLHGLNDWDYIILRREFNRAAPRGRKPFPSCKIKFSDKEKRRIVDKIITIANNGCKVKEAVKKAGIHYGVFHKWRKHATLKLLPKRERLAAYFQKKAERKIRVMDSVIADIKNGMKLKDAVKKAGINATTFHNWYKKYSTTPWTPLFAHRKEVPLKEARRLVNKIIADLNKGEMLKNALKKAGITGATYYRWQKCYATTKLLPNNKRPRMPAAEKVQKMHIINTAITEINNGVKVSIALKKAGITFDTMKKWSKLYASVKLLPKTKRLKLVDPEKAQRRAGLVDAVIAETQKGMSVLKAVKKIGISNSSFYEWAKRHADLITLKYCVKHPAPPGGGATQGAPGGRRDCRNPEWHDD